MNYYTETYINDLRKAQNVIPFLNIFKLKSVLITGASGLIGSSIVDFLLELNASMSANNHIYAAGRNIEKLTLRFSENYHKNNLHLIEYDATKNIHLSNHFDYIIHAASPSNPTSYVNYPVETMFANFIGMKNILEYAKKNSVERILYISSSEIYGKKQNGMPYKDNEYGYIDILNFRSCYPSSKRATETLCSAYYKEYGIESVIVRPGHVYGPTATNEDTRAATQFIRDVISGQDIIMKSKGTQLRSYCYVVDCVSAIISVLLNGKVGHAYNIANPNSNVSIRELAECIAHEAKKKIIFQMPTDTEKMGYNPMENSCLDASELMKLGWKGLFTLEQGIRNTLKILNDSKNKSN